MKKMVCWANESNSHGIVWKDIFFLEEDDYPDALRNPVRLPWLDETVENFLERVRSGPQRELKHD